ncbi:MAG: hypothetical protein WD342_02375 [Verrucomicrobiales bacterium]
MEILISEIPEEGLHREGEFPASIFDLGPDDPIQPAGPVHYVADIFAFDDIVTLHGSLRGTFRLQCGVCLEYFDYEADYPKWATELDLEEGQTSFDLQDLVREDFLLELPTNPRCDELLEDRACPKAHLFQPDDDESPPDEGDRPNVWGALDDLKR